MFKLRNKLNKKGGFTLIEMLIVVAIIAILIAVSIPLVTNALEKTRKATDAANERAAKAEAVICYLEAGKVDDAKLAKDTIYYYDAANGKLVSNTGFAKITPYGKCSTHALTNKGVLAVAVDETGTVYLQWVNEAITGDFDASDAKWNPDTLCSKNLMKTND